MATTDSVKIVLTIDDSNVSVATQRVGENLRRVQTAMQQTADSTKSIDKHFTGLTGKFRDLIVMGGMLRFAMYDIRDVFGITVGKVIESSAQIERMTKLMEGLSTATSQQAKQMEAISNRDFVFKMSKNAPFEVKALTDTFIKLKSAGIDPTDGSMQTLVNSVAKFGGSSETLQRASVAIQQMAGKGVISMEELRQQLGEAIPTAMKSMAIGSGMSMAELVKHISKGEVEASSALQRMFAVMKFENAGAAEEMNKTWVGQMEKLKTNFTLFANDVGNGGFFDAIKKSLGEVNAYMESNSGRRFAADIGDSLRVFIGGMSTLMQNVVKYGEQIKQLGQVLITIWGGQMLFKAFTGIESMISSYLAKTRQILAAEKTLHEARVAINREEIIQANLKNNAILENEIATNNGKLIALQIAKDKELEIMLAHNKRALAAQLSLESGLTTRGTPVNVGRATNTMLNQREFAREAQLAANMFAKSQEEMAAANAIAMAKITANTEKAGVALVAASNASKALSGAIGLMKGAFDAVGGWIGVITIALTAGIYMWEKWGDAAKKSAEQAEQAMRNVKNGFANQGDVQQLNAQITSASIRALELQKKIDDINARPTVSAGRAGVIDRRGQLKELQEQLNKEQALIKNAGIMLQVGMREATDNMAKEDAAFSQRQMDARISKMVDSNRNYVENQKAEIALMTISEDEKAKKISDVVREGAMNLARQKLKAYTDSNKFIEEELARGVTSDGRKITDRMRAQMELVKNLQLDAIAQINRDIETNKQIGSNPNFISKTDEKSGGGVRSKIQALIDDLKGKNVELQNETDKAKATLEKLEFDLTKTTKYWEKKKGVKVAPSEDKVIEALNAAADNYNKQKDEEKVKLLEKQSMDVGKAFESVQSAWEDGTAKVTAAMDNYYSSSKGDDKASEKQVRGFELMREAIVRYHTDAGVTAEAATAQLAEFDKKVKETLELPNQAKAFALADTFRKQAERINTSLIENASERAAKEGEIAIKALNDEYAQRVKTITAGSEAERELTKDYEAAKLALIRDTARKAETPMQSLARQWRDTTTQMQNASAKWANSTMDAFMELALTGKAHFKDLVTSILTDILRMQTQKQMSGMFEGIFGAIEKQIGGIIGGGKKVDETVAQTTVAQATAKSMEALGNSAKAAASKSGELAGSLGKSAVEGILQTEKSSMLGGAFDMLANSAIAAAEALNSISMTSGGDSGGGGGFFGKLVGGIKGLFGGGSDYEALPDFVPAFANGGVMTSMGAVELRKYANGGIASRPQMALYGEGSRPEAYVPLPDGRTIPVTMNGSGGNPVTVNVINQTSTPVNASQGQPRFDGKQMVLDIVLTAASQPGAFREGMKGALS